MIQLQNVSEIYSLKFWTPEKVLEEPVHALRNLSLKILRGESIAIIGENGAGKTTLLKVIAGLIDPTLGQVRVEGQTGVIMDLGCGFHPDLTGRENCLSAAPLYGKSKEEIQKILPDIERFAELGKFFHAAIRTYSHGMYLRLAFAFAIHLNPDILCIDDILTVGDEKSRYRCLKKVEELREFGISVLLVTHDLSLALQFAPRTLWLKEGQIHRDGNSEDVVNAYLQFCQTQKIEIPIASNPLYWGDLNTLCFKASSLTEPQALTRIADWSLKISEGEKIHSSSALFILETGKNFLRGIFKFDIAHFTAELILSMVDKDSFRVELFLENPIAYLPSFHWTLYCPWEIAWDSVELSPLPDPFLSVSQPGNCWSFEKALGLQFHFDPLLSLQMKQGNSWILDASCMPLPYPNSRSRLCALFFKMLEARKTMSALPIQELSQNTWKLQQIGPGFRLSKNGAALLTLLGFEILFDYQGQTLSSSRAEITRIDSKFSFHHFQWPVTFFCSIRFEKDCVILNWDAQSKIPAVPTVICNLRFQIFWNSSWTLCERPIHEAKNAPLVLKNGESSLCVQTSSKRSWLLAHDYSFKETEARVSTLFDPKPDMELPYEMQIFWNSTFIKPQALPVSEECHSEKSVLFQNGAFLMPNFLTGWHHYLSIFSSPLWHDSLQALWTLTSQGGEIYRGCLPWIPVELECEIIYEKNSILIGWRLHVLEKTCLEKVQLCFPIKNNAADSPAIVEAGIDVSRLHFPFLKTLENKNEKQLNFTWLCDPIFLDPGTFDLGWIILKVSA